MPRKGLIGDFALDKVQDDIEHGYLYVWAAGTKPVATNIKYLQTLCMTNLGVSTLPLQPPPGGQAIWKICLEENNLLKETIDIRAKSLKPNKNGSTWDILLGLIPKGVYPFISEALVDGRVTGVDLYEFTKTMGHESIVVRISYRDLEMKNEVENTEFSLFDMIEI